ncbi:MAG: hypothetical protein AB1458_17130, partial [Bacteroidota bacterium]
KYIKIKLPIRTKTNMNLTIQSFSHSSSCPDRPVHQLSKPTLLPLFLPIIRLPSGTLRQAATTVHGHNPFLQ